MASQSCVQTDEPIGMKTCFRHKTDSFIFCDTCKRIVCGACKECMSHQLTTTFHLVERNRDFLAKDNLLLFKDAIKDMRRANDKETLLTNNNIAKKKQAISDKQTQIDTSEEGRERDGKLIVEAISYIRETSEKAFSDSLKRACQRAAAVLDVGEEVDREIKGYNAQLAKMKEELANYNPQLMRLSNDKIFIDEMEKVDVDSEKTEDDLLPFAFLKEAGLVPIKGEKEQTRKAQGGCHAPSRPPVRYKVRQDSLTPSSEEDDIEECVRAPREAAANQRRYSSKDMRVVGGRQRKNKNRKYSTSPQTSILVDSPGDSGPHTIPKQ